MFIKAALATATTVAAIVMYPAQAHPPQNPYAPGTLPLGTPAPQAPGNCQTYSSATVTCNNPYDVPGGDPMEICNPQYNVMYPMGCGGVYDPNHKYGAPTTFDPKDPVARY